jgi:hypothetical protein
MERKCCNGNDAKHDDIEAYPGLPVDHENGEQNKNEQFPDIKKERKDDKCRQDKIDEHANRCKPKLERARKE